LIGGGCPKLKTEVTDLRLTMFRFEAGVKADVYNFFYSRPYC
jgi:hypothetical protein